ncbi:hypothetical protein MUK42_31778 [Musa troglodytarum]|uniref:Rapid alkalinization factor n=1 Tax=Musa troglodytarum TaxID=320322 RepID=A0A9E7JMS2_9LILI|nr:hypothetical protein MUK42_31778 [Musa troglodytarum]
MGRKTMWRCPAFFLLCASIVLGSIILSALPAAAAAAMDYELPRSCNSTDGRCGAEEVMVEEEEFQLDSEVNRRLLASQPSKLSYRAVFDKDRTTCGTTDGGRYSDGKCYPAPSGKKPNKIPCYYHYHRC